NGLPQLLVRLPTGAQPASSAGRALRGVADEESELGARPGHPWVLRCHRPRVAGAIRRASHRGSARRAAHPEMVERWRAGGWEANTRTGRDAARGQRLAAPGEYLPALRVRSLGSSIAKEAG